MTFSMVSWIVWKIIIFWITSIDIVALEGILGLPEQAKGVVIFAHGSGSSRLSPRNTCVAGVLQQAGIGTLLFDLLTTEEDRNYEHRFDIDLLALTHLAAEKELAVVPGATHLFEESGALEQVANLAQRWFIRHMGLL